MMESGQMGSLTSAVELTDGLRSRGRLATAAALLELRQQRASFTDDLGEQGGPLRRRTSIPLRNEGEGHPC